MKKAFILLCSLLSLSLAPVPLDLQVSLPGVYSPWPEVLYTIRITEPKGKVLCHGWFYPVLQWYIDEWPQRASCRFLTTEHIIQERWGGPYWPLPYAGEYRAFADLFDPLTRSHILVWKTFTIFESRGR